MLGKQKTDNYLNTSIKYEGLSENYINIKIYLYSFILISLYIFLDVSYIELLFNSHQAKSLPLVSANCFFILIFLYLLIIKDKIPNLSENPIIDLSLKNNIIITIIAILAGILSIYEFQAYSFVFSSFLFIIITPIIQTLQKRQFIYYELILLISFILSGILTNNFTIYTLFLDEKLLVMSMYFFLITIMSFSYSTHFTNYRKRSQNERTRNKDLIRKLEEDLSNRKGAEKKLHKIQRKLIKSINNERNTNQIKSDFIHTISQLYRTPLSGILNSTNIIEYAYNNNKQFEQIQPAILRIYTSINLMSKIIDDNIIFDDLTKSDDNYRIVDFELDEIVKEIFKRYQSNNQSKIHYNINSNEQIILKTKMELFIYTIDNIALNSAIYSFDNTTVDINYSNKNDYLHLTIVNEGQTIPPNEIEHVFKAFYSGSNKSQRSGIGLGLTIAKLCCEKLGGSIDISSYNNHTTVEINIPIKLEQT